MEKSTSGAEYLHSRVDKNLHHQPPVELSAKTARIRGERLPNEPAPKLDNWLKTLEHIHIGRDAKIAERIKKVYHQKFCLSPDKPMPDGFFNLQATMALNEGRVEVAGESHEERIKNLAAQFRNRYRSDEAFHDQVEGTKADYIDKQQRSLDEWVDYLSDPQTLYPMWFKYYVFRNITKMGGYDKQTGNFRKRSSQTTDPFPVVDSEALAHTLEALRQHYYIDLNDPEGEPAELDERTKELLDQDASFAQLYAHSLESLHPVSQEALNVTEGRWLRFPRGSSGEDLSSAVRAATTGWCIADSGTAGNYLQRGEFWVYVTPDPTQDGVEIPRIAIATSENGIDEVRGIVSHGGEARQHLEGVMTPIAQAKLQELPGGEQHYRAMHDMAQLTQIYEHLQSLHSMKAPLSNEQIDFLYELRSPIQSMGYGRDPRIDEIRQARAGVDSERLKPLLIEAIKQQTETSLKAVQEVMRNLNLPALTQEQFTQAFEAKWAEWQQNGTLEWVASRFETHGERYTLVTTPNELVNAGQLMDLADSFANGQGFDEAYKHPELYELYSLEQLSGTPEPDQLIRFSLMPDSYTSELGSNDVATQLDLLADMQAANPNLNLAIPSVLESESSWFALRSNGDGLNSGDVWARTYIRHIDLPDQPLGGDRFVPDSYVYDDGEPVVHGSSVTNRDDTRVVVR